MHLVILSAASKAGWLSPALGTASTILKLVQESEKIYNHCLLKGNHHKDFLTSWPHLKHATSLPRRLDLRERLDLVVPFRDGSLMRIFFAKRISFPSSFLTNVQLVRARINTSIIQPPTQYTMAIVSSLMVQQRMRQRPW